MNYIGSKKSLLQFLEESIYQIVGKKDFSFLDLFAGTGIVGSYFKGKGHSIIANDLQYYSFVLNRNYIKNYQILKFELLEKDLTELKKIDIAKKAEFVCSFLNNIEPKEGFIYNNYCLGGTLNCQFQRQYFSDKNGKKLDAIRQKIEQWQQENKVNDDEYYFLLASLIENIDKVANTASVYGAFLKQLKKSAQKEFSMKPADFLLSENQHEVYNCNIENLITKVHGDVLYLDPPYNQRQYSANYHLLETIARYDNPQIKGKTGLRNYVNQKSKFSQKNEVLKSFTNIINNAKVKYIFLSYNNEGLMTTQEIAEIMAKRGSYGLFTKTYQRFKADKSKNRNYQNNLVIEYLHYVKCQD